MALRIDKKLNLVIPVERDDGSMVYVHSMPISREVFETYYLEISKAFAMIHSQGLGAIAGPRVAALLLKRAAQETGNWDGDSGVANGLMNEMIRLTNVVAPAAGRGWAVAPYEEAYRAGTISPDDDAEIKNAIVYFTLASSMYRRNILADVLDGAGKLWGAQSTSSNCTEYAASLLTLMQDEIFVAETVTPVGLSVPS